MSEILTAEQVAELFANQMNTQCRVYFEVVGQSHEALRDLYDALLQGATAQRVATLMDEADKARVEISWLKEVQAENKGDIILLHNEADILRVEIERLAKERGIAQHEATRAWGRNSQLESINAMIGGRADATERERNDAWAELATLRARIAELEKERDAALELAARREKENRLILRLHKRNQGISDDALQHSIAERDGLRGAIGAIPVLLFEAAVFIEQVSFSSAISAKESDRLQWSGEKYREAEKIIASALAAVPAPATRDDRQREVHDWCSSAFGADHAASIPQRGIRLLEEAIEACQSAGCDLEMARKLVDYVFSKPAHNLAQELGGVGITLLALAEAAGVSADVEEAREMERVKAFPLSHFKARNEAKNAAGFNIGWSAPVDEAKL